MAKSNIYAFWPYLKTSRSFGYHGISFKDVEDRAGLPAKVSRDINALHKMFYLQNHLRIRRMMYSYIELQSSTQEREVLKTLLEFRTLVGYLYTAPGPGGGDPFLSWEHCSLFLFRPQVVSKGLVWPENNVESVPKSRRTPEADRWGQVAGFEGLLNNKSHMWVAKGSCIYPPSSRMWLNVSQDVSDDLHEALSTWSASPVYSYFFSDERGGGPDERFLTSLRWYNRSASSEIDDEIKIIHLSIAFESLLGLEQREGIAVRFKESVNLLLGKLPRLDSWLEQFYRARSEIIHEGSSGALSFIASDLKRKQRRLQPGSAYKPLISYGRLIFRACVAAIISGTKTAIKLRLPSMMVTNTQRLENICQVLDKGEDSPQQRLLALEEDILDVEFYQFEPDEGLRLPLVLGAARSVAKHYLQARSNDIGRHDAKLKAFVNARRTDDHFNELEALKDLDDFVESTRRQFPDREDKLASLAASLLGTVWRWTFTYFFALEEEKKKATESNA